MNEKRWDVITGDCSVVLRDQGRASVNLVVTSPPYFGLRDYGMPGEIGAERTPEEYVQCIMRVLRQIQGVLAPDGSVFMVIGDKYARTGGVDRKVRGTNGDPGGRAHTRPVQRGVPGVKDGSLIGLPYRVALAAIEDGWVWRQDIIWHKPNPLPESVRNRAVRSHETILHLSRTNRPYVNSALPREHDVWDLPVQGYRDPLNVGHPAIYPEALVRKLIDGYCPPEGVVLDPFAGSGTTLAQAVRMGRRAWGIELNPDYADVARRRVAAADGPIVMLDEPS
jgi:DNA modification methylase